MPGHGGAGERVGRRGRRPAAGRVTAPGPEAGAGPKAGAVRAGPAAGAGGRPAGPGVPGGSDELERALRLHRLYDLYRGLLTPRQQDVFELYHWQDLSLAEVAEHLQVSRQAVHDLLRRGEAVLEQAEAALGVVAWRRREERRLRRLAALLRAAEAELAATRGAAGGSDPGVARARRLLAGARRLAGRLLDDMQGGV